MTAYEPRHRDETPAATQLGIRRKYLARNGRGVVHTPRHNAALRVQAVAA